jgi:pimeloyl-ACP methyl ester carboxylesterase
MMLQRILRFTFYTILMLILLPILLFWKNDIPLEELKKEYTNPSSKFTVINGINVHYRDEGNQNDSIPLVLIHGTGASLHTWEGCVEKLKSVNRIITMDLPAYGLTGPNLERNYSIDNYVIFIDQLLEHLKIKKCILGGNSLGGGIAWNYTIAHPEKVKKLILIDASGVSTKAKSIPLAFRLARLPLLKNLFLYVTPKFIASQSLRNVYADPAKCKQEDVDRYYNLTLREGNRQAFIDKLNTPPAQNKISLLKNILHPTLILWGDQDKLIPISAAYMFQELLKNDTLIVLNGVGHVPMEENPIATSKAIQDFISKPGE